MGGSSRNAAFPYAWRLKCTLTYTPHTYGLLHRSPAALFTTCIEHNVSDGVTDLAITVPRAPSPPWGVTPPRVVDPRPRSLSAKKICPACQPIVAVCER